MPLSSSNVAESSPPLAVAVPELSDNASANDFTTHAARPPVVNRDSVELAARLRAGTLQTTDELARALGLTAPMLRSLVGAFPTTCEQPFRLHSSDTGAAQTFSFDGATCRKIDTGTDVTLLKDAFAAHGLAVIHTDTVDPAVVKAALQSQRTESADAAEMTHFSRQVETIHEGIATVLPLVDSQIDFTVPWRARLGMLLAGYPKPGDWKGVTKMPVKPFDDYARKSRIRDDAATRLINAFDNAVTGKSPTDAARLGRHPELDRLFDKVNARLEQNVNELERDIRACLQTYKHTDRSAKAMNLLFDNAARMLDISTRISHNHFVLGILTCYRDGLRQMAEGKCTDEERKKFVATVTGIAPKAIQQEFIPKVGAWRDFHKFYNLMRASAPEKAFTNATVGLDTYARMGASRLEYMWGIEAIIARGEWESGVRTETTRSQLETLAQKLSLQRLHVEEGADKREAAIFLSDLHQLIAFSDFQMEVLGSVVVLDRKRNAKLIDRQTIETLGENFALAMRAFQEMGVTYTYFREMAGKPSAPDEVMGALARRAVIMEAEMYICKNVAPNYSRLTAISARPVKVAANDKGWQPQEIVIPDADASSGTSAAQAPVPDVVAPRVATDLSVAVPPASFKERLAQARSHIEEGNQVFAGIARSSSQETNPFRVSSARIAFQAAHTLMSAVLTEPGYTDAAKRPDDLDLDAIKEEAAQAELSLQTMKNLQGSQSVALRWPTSHGAMERLYQNKKGFAVRRPEKFLHEFRTTNHKTGAVRIDKMIEVAIDLYAHATLKDDSRKTLEKRTLVQTVFLHCHYRTSLVLETPQDLAKVKRRDIEFAHVKPAIYRTLTQARAPDLPTETGQAASRKVEIPLGEVTPGIALNFLAMASKAE